MIRGTGCIPDTTGHCGPGVNFGAGREGLPLEFSLVDKIPVVFDQFDYDACVANAAAGVLLVAMAQQMGVEWVRQRLPVLTPSRRFIYSRSRALHHDERTDRGTYVHTAFQALMLTGFCSEDEWPYPDFGHGDAINELPTADMVADAWDQRWVTGYRRIEQDSELRDRLKALIAAGHPVEFGMPINAAYMDMSNARTWAYDGGRLGGHATYLVGYDREAAWSCGSYGKGHGADGIVRVKWETIEDYGFDFFVAEVAPIPSDVEVSDG